jgi:hypothetical protein
LVNYSILTHRLTFVIACQQYCTDCHDRVYYGDETEVGGV